MKIYRICRKCNKDHEVYYLRMKNDTLHLCMKCGNYTVFIPYEAGLKIPERKSGALAKLTKKNNTLEQDISDWKNPPVDGRVQEHLFNILR